MQVRLIAPLAAAVLAACSTPASRPPTQASAPVAAATVAAPAHFADRVAFCAGRQDVVAQDGFQLRLGDHDHDDAVVRRGNAARSVHAIVR